MLKEIVYTNKYKKDLKNVANHVHFDEEILESIIYKLASGEKLERKYRKHKMINKKLYKGSTSIHMAADLIVMYKMDESTLTLMRIGSHSSLLGNECGNTHYRNK